MSSLTSKPAKPVKASKMNLRTLAEFFAKVVSHPTIKNEAPSGPPVSVSDKWVVDGTQVGPIIRQAYTWYAKHATTGTSTSTTAFAQLREQCEGCESLMRSLQRREKTEHVDLSVEIAQVNGKIAHLRGEMGKMATPVKSTIQTREWAVKLNQIAKVFASGQSNAFTLCQYTKAALKGPTGIDDYIEEQKALEERKQHGHGNWRDNDRPWQQREHRERPESQANRDTNWRRPEGKHQQRDGHSGDRYVPPSLRDGRPPPHPFHHEDRPSGQKYVPPSRRDGNAYVPPQQRDSHAYVPPQQRDSHAYVPPHLRGVKVENHYAVLDEHHDVPNKSVAPKKEKVDEFPALGAGTGRGMGAMGAWSNGPTQAIYQPPPPLQKEKVEVPVAPRTASQAYWDEDEDDVDDIIIDDVPWDERAQEGEW